MGWQPLPRIVLTTDKKINKYQQVKDYIRSLQILKCEYCKSEKPNEDNCKNCGAC